MKKFRSKRELKKEIERLESENKTLNYKVNILRKEINDNQVQLENYYNTQMNNKIDIMKAEYNTKITRKKQTLELVKLYEEKLKSLITAKIEIDIQNDIDNYIKLLNYLKEI